VIGAAGPTTSGRMDAYSPRLLELGQCVMIGKGRRSQAVRDAIVRNTARCILAAVGGAGALMAECIKSVDIICWEDLGCEAVRRLVVEDMPLTVVIDSARQRPLRAGPGKISGKFEMKMKVNAR
jgi:fumarate hydratase subunit beta